MGEYVVVVSHSWTAIVEADTVEGAKESALAMDEEIPCDAMGTDVEVVAGRLTNNKQRRE